MLGGALRVSFTDQDLKVPRVCPPLHAAESETSSFGGLFAVGFAGIAGEFSQAVGAVQWRCGAC